MAQPFVVIQRLENGTLRQRARVGASAVIVDMAAMKADPRLAIEYVGQLLAFQHPDAKPIIDDLLTWFFANAVVTPAEPAG